MTGTRSGYSVRAWCEFLGCFASSYPSTEWQEVLVKKLPFTPTISILYLVKRIQFSHFRGLGVSEARVEFETRKFLSTFTVAIPVLPNYVARARAGLEALQVSVKAPNTHGGVFF